MAEPITVMKTASVIYSLRKKPWFWVSIVTILLLPFIVVAAFFILVAMCVTAIFGIFQTESLVYQNAIESVREEYKIENYFSYGSLRVIDIIMDGEEASEKELKKILVDFFIEKIEEQIEVTNNDGQVQTITKIYVVFKENEQIKNTLSNYPFEFSSDEIDMVFAMPLFSKTGDYLKPIENGRITSPYGSRKDPFTGEVSFHKGIDIVSPGWNAPVYAIADGTVYSTPSDSIGGNMLIIRHEEGIYSFYAHLATVNVSQGQTVFAGQSVGTKGGDPNKDPNPGMSTGQHLHFEIRTSPHSQNHTDPIAYIGEF